MSKQLTLLETTEKLKKKFIITVILAILFAVLTLFTSFKTNGLHNQRLFLQKESTSLKEASAYLTDQIKLYALSGDSKFRDNYLKETNETKTTTKSLENIISIGIKDKELAAVSTSKSESDKLIKIENEAIKHVETGNLQKAQELVLGSNYDSSKLTITDNISKFQTSLMNRITLTLNIYEVLLFAFNAITIVLVLLIVYSFNKYAIFIKLSVLKPILSLKNCFSEISNGNLNTVIDLNEDHTEIGEFTTVAKKTQVMLKDYIDDISNSLSKISTGDISTNINREYIGDFDKIKISINGIVDSLNEILSEIRHTAKQVSLGSDEVAHSSTLLSEGATNQAASIEELSATINEMHNKVKLNSKSAENVSNIIKETSEQMANSSEKMNAMLLAMKNITTASKRISEIVSKINSMAFQTNLLAVNTSIEASKSNGNGKQFAVIADEIRKLADSSSNAAKETSKLIDESLLAVSNGNALAKETSSMIKDIVIKSSEISALATDISSSSSEQEISTGEINKATEEISRVVETNSSTAEEFSAASQELAAQASHLSESVMNFKLKNN